MVDANQAVNLAQTLTVPFAAGFVVQRFLEILDPLFPDSVQKPNRKKVVMGLVSLAIGLWLASSGIRVFAPIGASVSGWEDVLLSGIFISAGTEGFNTLLKFANYKKEASKADAADKQAAVGNQKLQLVNKQA
ncbi:MAG: hypothetical protein ABSD76_16885 [Terriglobales bacterium]|jgi:hypothetical protein